MNFEKYIGIPFLEKGRDVSGVDCWGLVRLIYKQEYNINLPSFVADYELSDDQRIGELFAQYKEGWTTLTQPEPGCAVIFRMFGTESHIGVAVDNAHFIHVREGRDTVIESLESSKWAKRIVGFYKYSEGANAVLNAVPHPLKTQRYLTTVVPGTRVSELVQNICQEHNIQPELKSRISVLVNGRVIAQELWNTQVIQLGDAIEYRAVPGKEAIRIVAVIAISIYAPIIATQMLQSAAVAAAAAGSTITAAMGYGIYFGSMAAVHLIGGALINALAPIRPPPDPRDPGTALRQEMLAGGQNRGNPYGAIPVILGKLRVTPPLGSNNYLSFENERDSFLSMLLVWGYGPLNIDRDTLRIGGVPLTDYPKHQIATLDRKTEPSAADKVAFDAIYGQDYSPAIQAGPLICDGNPEGVISGYTNGNAQYDNEGSFTGYEQVPVYTPAPPGPWINASTNVELDVDTGLPVPVSQVRIDLHFPQGLRYVKTSGRGAGDSVAVAVQFRVEYSVDNGTNYTLLEEFTIGGDTPKRDAFTFTKSYTFNQTQLVIRIRRQTGDNVEDNPDRRYYFDSILQNITFVRNNNPAIDPVGAKIAKTAFKIQASEQLNGSLEGISAVVQTWCKVWNGTAWVDGATSNPAALMRYVLEHPANPRRVTDAGTQINLTELQRFYNYCQTRGFEYNNVLTSARSILEVLRDICAAGRASPALVDGKWSVIIDEPRTNIVQHFTPHNSWGFEGTKALPKRPDGLRINYYDEDQDYQEAEIIVYDIGKATNNASLFESITLPGVTKKSLVIDHAKWHMAQMKLRPEVYVLNTDLEYLVCNRGDLVKVMHDVPMWGLSSGRIKDRITASIFELDEEVPVDNAKSYTLRVRSSTGQSTELTVKTTFAATTLSRTSNIATVTLNEQHPIQVGDRLTINLTGTTTVNASSIQVTEVTPTAIKFASTGTSIPTVAVGGTVSLQDGYYSRLQTTATATEDQVNDSDLFLYGEYKTESQDLIVLGIEPSTNNTARITLVDYGVTDTYNIFTEYLTFTEATVFESQLSLPPQLLINSFGTKIPAITSLTSSDAAMEEIAPGVYRYSIKVSFTNALDLPTNAVSVEAEILLKDSQDNTNTRSVTTPLETCTLTFNNVDVQKTYKIRLRYLGRDGRAGQWTEYQEHMVVGKVQNYKIVDQVTVVRSKRNLIITPYIEFIPNDFKSFEVRVWKNSGTGDFWDTVNSEIKVYSGIGAITIDLKDFASPRLSEAGVRYRIACRVLDNAGNYSISSTLGAIIIKTISP